MNKFTLLLIAFCLSLSGVLSGCSRLPSSPGMDKAAPEPVEVEDVVLPQLSKSESLGMQSYMSGGRAIIINDRLYCMDFDENFTPALCSYDLTSGKPGNFTVLISDCVPEYLCAYGERIYFIDKKAGGNIESVDLYGGDRQIVKEGPCDFLRIYEDKMYYCDSARRFCVSSPLGAGEEIIMSETCYYPYVTGDSFIYQLGRNEQLYIKNLSTGIETELTDLPSYAPVIAEGRLYCTVPGGVLSIAADGLNPLKYELGEIQGTAELALIDDKIYIRGVSGGKEIREWNFSTENPKESFQYEICGNYSLCQYTDESFALYANYEAGGRIKSYTLIDDKGGQTQFLLGKSLY